jgi:uncharacterized membrane protein YphA (DoxX/SURF4 family)
VTERIRNLDRAIARLAARAAPHVLRGGLGIVFVWFGALKFQPGLSPAEGLIAKTVSWAVEPELFIPVLAFWECAMGVALLLGRFPRATLFALGAHMAGTFMPLVACPDEVWTAFPHVLTLEGQYIVKNLVLVGAGLAVTDHLRRRPAPRKPAARTMTRDVTWVDETLPARRRITTL